MTARRPLGIYPSMPIYVGDWFRGRATRTMTPEQKSAYMELLLHAWPTSPENLANPCTLPDNEGDLAQLSGLGVERWAAVGQKVRAQFQPVGGGLIRNAKQYAVYTQLVTLSETRSENGKDGALTRWGNDGSEVFRQAWELWLGLKRLHNSRKMAWNAWSARLREGATEEALLAATQLYCEWIRAMGKVGTDKFLMASTFYGPNERWKEEWRLPTAAAVKPEQKPASAPMDRARSRWDFYNREGLTSAILSSAEWETKIADLVSRGEWVSTEAARAELRCVKPWDIVRTMRDATDAVFRVNERLKSMGVA